MLLLFPLFTGFSGYGNITFSKFLFFLISAALWLAAIIALSLWKKLPFPRFGLPQWLALGFGLVCFISWLCSPWRGESLIGAGRYEGLLTQEIYVLIFLGVSLWGQVRERHI